MVVPLKTSQPEEVLAGVVPLSDNKRRKKKSRHSESHAWDSTSGKMRRSGRDEKRQMFWMLVGGATLFALIVAGVFMAQLGGDKPAPPVSAPPAADSKANPADSPAAQKSDAALLAEAEPLTKKFLEATRIEDLLPLVRNPKLAEGRMRRQYPDGKLTAPGMSGFNTQSEVARKGPIFSVNVRTRDYEEKTITFAETPEGVRIDWESWVGWSEMPWGAFLDAKPKEATVFRVNLSAVEYYNVAFTDDTKWKSYRLESPDGKHAIYGYAEVGSVLNAKLRPPPDIKSVGMILAVRFPENAASGNQVIIEKCIAEGWVLENEDSP